MMQVECKLSGGFPVVPSSWHHPQTARTSSNRRGRERLRGAAGNWPKLGKKRAQRRSEGKREPRGQEMLQTSGKVGEVALGSGRRQREGPSD